MPAHKALPFSCLALPFFGYISDHIAGTHDKLNLPQIARERCMAGSIGRHNISTQLCNPTDTSKGWEIVVVGYAIQDQKNLTGHYCDRREEDRRCV